MPSGDERFVGRASPTPVNVLNVPLIDTDFPLSIAGVIGISKIRVLVPPLNEYAVA